MRRSKVPTQSDVTSPSEDEYFVEKILSKKVVQGKDYYLIKWEGFPLSQSTWEPRKNLTRSRELLEEYERKLQNTRGKRQPRTVTASSRQIKNSPALGSTSHSDSALSSGRKQGSDPVLQPRIVRRHPHGRHENDNDNDNDNGRNQNVHPFHEHKHREAETISERCRTRERLPNLPAEAERGRAPLKNSLRPKEKLRESRQQSKMAEKRCSPEGEDEMKDRDKGRRIGRRRRTRNGDSSLASEDNKDSAHQLETRIVRKRHKDEGKDISGLDIDGSFPVPKRIMGCRIPKSGVGLEYVLEWQVEGQDNPLKACCSTEEVATYWPRLLIDYLERHVTLNKNTKAKPN